MVAAVDDDRGGVELRVRPEGELERVAVHQLLLELVNLHGVKNIRSVISFHS